MLTFLPAPIDLRCSKAVFKQLVKLRLVLDLRMLGLDLLKLDCYLVAVLLIYAEEYLTEGTAAKFRTEHVLVVDGRGDRWIWLSCICGTHYFSFYFKFLF